MSDAPSYTTAFIADQQKFNARVLFIATQLALTVLAENPNTANHPPRAVFAVKILQRGIRPETLAEIVLADPNIQAAAIADLQNSATAVADIDIQSRLQLVWDSLALAAV